MMKGALGELMKQAQKMQENMQKAQEELSSTEVHGESGAGLVKVTLNGRFEVLAVALEPSLLTEDKKVIEELIASAFSDALKKVESINKESLSGLTGGIELPAGFKMPF